VRFAYADPPYPDESKDKYEDHPDYAGEVDHAELIARMDRDYDGWLLHTKAPALWDLLPLCPRPPEVRIFAWVKGFAAFKRNVSPAYAWEPVIVKPLRKAEPNQRATSEPMRDWLMESITLKRGLAGAKPERTCRWLFEACGLRPDDELDDLFPGTGAVMDAWLRWSGNAPVETEQMELRA
jgi:hypothetical protein